MAEPGADTDRSPRRNECHYTRRSSTEAQQLPPPTHQHTSETASRPTTTPRNQKIACRSCDRHHGGRHPRAQQKRNTNITTCNLQGAGSEEGKRHLSDLDLKLSKTRERSTPACTNQSRVSPLLMIWVIITPLLCVISHTTMIFHQCS